MRVTVRAKLFAVMGVAGLCLLLLVVVGWMTAARVHRQIVDIQHRYVPLIGLQPRLQSGFQKLEQSLRGAVSASDEDFLHGSRAIEEHLLDELDSAHGAVDAAAADQLKRDIESYYTTAYDVSRRLIAGETGEAIVNGMSDMQARRARAVAQIDAVSAFDPGEMARAFDDMVSMQRTATHQRLAISCACLLAVIVLLLWINRGIRHSLSALMAGFGRFADGNFAAPIPVVGHDELGDVSMAANDMADSLARLSEANDRVDWLRNGRAGLTQELRGALEPEAVAQRALGFLCRYTGAPVGALYYGGAGGSLRLLGRHGVAAEAPMPLSFERGQGLIGQAAVSGTITIVSEVPADHLRLQSGLISGSPDTLVLVPLAHQDDVTGVMELGVLGELSEQVEELLQSVREPLASSLEVARAAAARAELLAETQRQAATLAAARRSLELKARELAAASAYKSQFLANMSHELRTPLNAIIGFAELMVDGAVRPDSPEHDEFLGDILTSGRHLLQLINDVLDLSKVEAGKLEFRPEPIDLDQLIGEVLAILRTSAASRRVRVTSEVDPAVSALYLDPARLKQVLYNYVSNAIKFTSEAGRVMIRAVADGSDHVRIEVEDTGIGIEEADLKHLFVEFKQIHHDGQPKGGTGLGLALTKRLVEAQGGVVGASSEVGRGSIFHARLPRRADPTGARRVPGVAAQLPPAMAKDAGVTSILVIEDDPEDQRDLVATLTRAGYAVEACNTGGQAVARCRERRFDGITLDLLLPDMSGLDVLQQIRAEGLNIDVPVIVVTVVAERGALAGFAVNDMLPKPLEHGQLLAALERASVSSHPQGPVLVVDDDPGSLRLMAATLERLGYPARCEQDGEKALGLAMEDRPSAIVLDLCMPGMDGFEFLDRLRHQPGGEHVPVIVWTVKDLSEEEHGRLKSTAQGVVNKGRGGSAAVVEQLASWLPTTREAAGEG